MAVSIREQVKVTLVDVCPDIEQSQDTVKEIVMTVRCVSLSKQAPSLEMVVRMGRIFLESL